MEITESENQTSITKTQRSKFHLNVQVTVLGKNAAICNEYSSFYVGDLEININEYNETTDFIHNAISHSDEYVVSPTK